MVHILAIDDYGIGPFDGELTQLVVVDGSGTVAEVALFHILIDNLLEVVLGECSIEAVILERIHKLGVSECWLILIEGLDVEAYKCANPAVAVDGVGVP